MRRIVLVVCLAIALMVPANAVAAASSASSDQGDIATTTTIDNSFLDTKRDLSECLNNSIQLPDCGSEPIDEGNRGGALQFATFGVMLLGIGFIGWRITRSIRARDAALTSRNG